MSIFANYDPGQLITTFDGNPIVGFADGVMVKASRKTDTFSMNVGTQGDVARVRSQDKTGEVVITLQQSSPTNDYFSSVLLLDEQFGLSVGPLLIKDLNGTTVISAAIAWLKKPADSEFGKDLTNREWTFECAELKMLVGGSLISAPDASSGRRHARPVPHGITR